MSPDESKVLDVLAVKNGQTVSAEDLKQQTGFSDERLQTAMAALHSRGFSEWVTGSELDGKPLRFYSAFITSLGTTAGGDRQ